MNMFPCVAVSVAVFCAAIPAQSVHAANATNACLLKRGDVITFFGDSLTSRRVPPSLDTWAYLQLSNWEKTYADEVGKFLFCVRPDLNVKCFNAAIGGSTCRTVQTNLDTFVLSHKPAWVIGTLGGNDVMLNITVEEFESRLSNVAARVAAQGGRMMFVNGFLKKPLDVATNDAYVVTRQPYRAALGRIVAQFNGIYCDVGPALLDKAAELRRQHETHTVYSDNSEHLNEVGSRIIAAEVLEALGVLTLNK